ncbi:MAG: glycosyltransferase family 4 protein [Actinomycetota bacterium]|nr:glycosyltransferase family 4 protein [Actinomycetota bacterium]
MPERRIVMTLAFYPRGGSAQVVRYLGEALEARGDHVTVCCGSLGSPGAASHAATFFGNLDVATLDFTEAVAWFEEGRDPMAAPVPIHPSFEDRPGVPDRVFASLNDDAYHRQVAAWESLLARVEEPDLYHVHHVTHVNDAIEAVSDRPVVVHLHGTEMKMLDEIRRGGTDQWGHGAKWSQRFVRAAKRADRIIVISPTDRELAIDLLGVDPSLIEIVPNGVDVNRFTPLDLTESERLDRWRRWLVQEPGGWDETGLPGTIRYSDDDIDRLFLHRATCESLPVLLFVGRFLDFKRVPLLIRSYASVRQALGSDAPPLVVWGGYPGEWEGDHPNTLAEALGVEGVFFAGWRGHEDLATGFNCADVFVAPSVDEPFGQVYLEAMACGLPVIATNSGGPMSFVNTDPDRPNGWRVTPDSETALAGAMIEAVSNPVARFERGRDARQMIEREYDWGHVAEHIDRIYSDVLAQRRR